MGIFHDQIASYCSKCICHGELEVIFNNQQLKFDSYYYRPIRTRFVLERSCHFLSALFTPDFETVYDMKMKVDFSA